MTNFANEPVIADAWYIAGWSHELSDGPVARHIMDEDVVLFRTVKVGWALEDRCCHRGVRLSLGESTDAGIGAATMVWLSGLMVNVLIIRVKS